MVEAFYALFVATRFAKSVAGRGMDEKNRPDIVIIAAATVGGIDDNKSRPVEFF